MKYKEYINKELIEILKPYSASKSMQDWEISEIYNLAKASNNTIVEIGAYRGRSTIALALGNREGNKNKIISIDPFIAHGEVEQNKETCLRYWDRAKVRDEITLIQDYSYNVNLNENIGFLLIDGEHTYEGVKNDYLKFSPLVEQGGFIAFHDFHLKGVKQFFDEFIYPTLKDDFVEFRVVGSLIVIKKLKWRENENN